LVFGHFEIAQGTDGYGDYQAVAFGLGKFDRGSWYGLGALGYRWFSAEDSYADQDSYDPGND
jgi:hypothetical protein